MVLFTHSVLRPESFPITHQFAPFPAPKPLTGHLGDTVLMSATIPPEFQSQGIMEFGSNHPTETSQHLSYSNFQHDQIQNLYHMQGLPQSNLLNNLVRSNQQSSALSYSSEEPFPKTPDVHMDKFIQLNDRDVSFAYSVVSAHGFLDTLHNDQFNKQQQQVYSHQHEHLSYNQPENSVTNGVFLVDDAISSSTSSISGDESVSIPHAATTLYSTADDTIISSGTSLSFCDPKSLDLSVSIGTDSDDTEDENTAMIACSGINIYHDSPTGLSQSPFNDTSSYVLSHTSDNPEDPRTTAQQDIKVEMAIKAYAAPIGSVVTPSPQKRKYRKRKLASEPGPERHPKRSLCEATSSFSKRRGRKPLKDQDEPVSPLSLPRTLHKNADKDLVQKPAPTVTTVEVDIKNILVEVEPRDTTVASKPIKPKRACVKTSSLEEEEEEEDEDEDDSDSNGKPKNFLCDLCDRKFRRQEHLKRHYRSLHTREKPFECELCSKRFSRSDNLTQHMRVHSQHKKPTSTEVKTRRSRR